MSKLCFVFVFAPKMIAIEAIVENKNKISQIELVRKRIFANCEGNTYLTFVIFPAKSGSTPDELDLFLSNQEPSAPSPFMKAKCIHVLEASAKMAEISPFQKDEYGTIEQILRHGPVRQAPNVMSGHPRNDPKVEESPSHEHKNNQDGTDHHHHHHVSLLTKTIDQIERMHHHVHKVAIVYHDIIVGIPVPESHIRDALYVCSQYVEKLDIQSMFETACKFVEFERELVGGKKAKKEPFEEICERLNIEVVKNVSEDMFGYVTELDTYYYIPSVYRMNENDKAPKLVRTLTHHSSLQRSSEFPLQDMDVTKECKEADALPDNASSSDNSDVVNEELGVDESSHRHHKHRFDKLISQRSTSADDPRPVDEIGPAKDLSLGGGYVDSSAKKDDDIMDLKNKNVRFQLPSLMPLSKKCKTKKTKLPQLLIQASMSTRLLKGSVDTNLLEESHHDNNGKYRIQDKPRINESNKTPFDRLTQLIIEEVEQVLQPPARKVYTCFFLCVVCFNGSPLCACVHHICIYGTLLCSKRLHRYESTLSMRTLVGVMPVFMRYQLKVKNQRTGQVFHVTLKHAMECDDIPNLIPLEFQVIILTVSPSLDSPTLPSPIQPKLVLFLFKQENWNWGYISIVLRFAFFVIHFPLFKKSKK
ncbi:hypothetical protein RFI_08266 [Reticulomyxa filosa]|uniref:Uncharacterized protein n=1 Tax=Reticulomyxa filosa TaxID=46433 RepID=X6NSX1_RETFI|nr:hypothetical protein RFI_08266 [Reticulomyxa filosa]|eukprot:ETO28859.1 hypothetical protein RFI_08266 [Reticulomyxa filosa]